jgi:hypothetical protein
VVVPPVPVVVLPVPVEPPVPVVVVDGGVQVDGDPAAIQFDSVAISADVARAAGAGGMGLTVSCILCSATETTVLDGLLRAGATRSANVTSGIGTPVKGGLE